MTTKTPIAGADAYRSAQPIVRTIGTADLRDALARGFADFNAMPTHLLLICIIYPVVMVIIAGTYAGYEVLPLVFPLLAGFTLIGPLAATGMYELSRRRERDLDISRGHAFDILRFASIRTIATLSAVLMGIYFGWLSTALVIYEQIFGNAAPTTIAEFTRQVFTTPTGLTLILVGCGVGFLFAVLVFTFSVVSFPLLLDHRHAGTMTAIQTSIRAVLANPKTMAIWGLIVAGGLLLGSLPFFVGLAFVMPVLGHSTWHLYRKVVEWPPNSGH